MYRCEQCHVITPPLTPTNRIPEQVRPKRYPHRHAAFPPTGKGRKKDNWVDDPGGEGFEIVSERRVCHTCYAKWMEDAPPKMLGAAGERAAA